LSDALAFVGSVVDSADRVGGVDLEGTETTHGSGPLVVIVSAFSIFDGLDIGALGSTHIPVCHAIASADWEKRIVTRTSDIGLSWNEIPIMFVPPPLSDDQLRSCKSDVNRGGDLRGARDHGGGVHYMLVVARGGSVVVQPIDAPSVVGPSGSGLGQKARVLVGDVVDSADLLVHSGALAVCPTGSEGEGPDRGEG